MEEEEKAVEMQSEEARRPRVCAAPRGCVAKRERYELRLSLKKVFVGERGSD